MKEALLSLDTSPGYGVSISQGHQSLSVGGVATGLVLLGLGMRSDRKCTPALRRYLNVRPQLSWVDDALLLQDLAAERTELSVLFTKTGRSNIGALLIATSGSKLCWQWSQKCCWGR